MHSIPLLSLDPHAPPRTAVRKHILALRHAAACAQPDWLAVEEPLEIRVQGPGTTRSWQSVFSMRKD